MKHFKHLFLALGCASALVAGAEKINTQTPGVLALKNSITDNAIVYPESFETDTRKLLEGWYMKNYTATDQRYERESDANVSDREITERLAKLPTVIDMPFNSIVRSYIDRYTRNGRAQVAAILGLSHYYCPIFEQALEKRGLPLELKYLPVIESGLDPNAVSKHGATGLWQLMLATGKGLGLEVSSLVDERRDPYASSEKAADYLKDLYDAYGDWTLAIAAYNCGPGSVNKAIRRAGGDPSKQDFWSIYGYLSPETRGYVPLFIAANYVMNYYPAHNISPVLPTKPLVTDTLHISERIHFNQIAAILDIPVEELRLLNPQFRADVIPGTAERPYTLVLPSQQCQAYLVSEQRIRDFEAEKYARRTVAEPGESVSDATLAVVEMESPASDQLAELADSPVVQRAAVAAVTGANAAVPAKTVIHKVAPGESLATIADKYGVSPQSVKETNGLRRNAVRVGQQLKIAVADGNAQGTAVAENALVAEHPVSTQSANNSASAQQKNVSKKNKITKKAEVKPIDHQIKSGESLSAISRKYGVTVEELKKANNMKGDNIRAGDNLKIPSKGGATTSKSKSSKGKKKKRRR